MLKTVTGSTTVVVAVTHHKYRSQFIDDDETVNLYSVIVIKGNNGCFFKFGVEVGVEESIVNALYG
jgi:hypothetical protein